jgi:2-keto-4-pentenoate hydratase
MLVSYADAIVAAHREHRLLTPSAPLTMTEAYEVQRLVVAHRLARGERRVGWKIGYTSAAMRAQMGVDEPNFGPLTDAMMLRDGDDVGDAVTQPRVEPEIAVVVDGEGDVLAAFGALEVVDSVWRDYAFRIEDNTADGSSAAFAVLGPRLNGDFAEVPVRLLADGAEAAAATGAAALGHPLTALQWLRAALADRGERLQPGDMVLTGGLTAAVPLVPGGAVTGEFEGFGTVTVHRRSAHD